MGFFDSSYDSSQDPSGMAGMFSGTDYAGDFEAAYASQQGQRDSQAVNDFTKIASKKMVPAIAAIVAKPMAALGLGAKVINDLRKGKTIGDSITAAMKEKGYTDAEISRARGQVASQLQQLGVVDNMGGGQGGIDTMSLYDVAQETGESVEQGTSPAAVQNAAATVTSQGGGSGGGGGGGGYVSSPTAGSTGIAIKQLQEQMLDTISTLTDVGKIRDLSMVYGGLTPQQEKYISSIEKNSINLLTDTITEETADSFESSLAHLIDKGVLQGDVGQITINKLYESAQKAIQRGTVEILNTGLAQRLALMEANADRQLQVSTANQQADIERAKLGLASKVAGIQGLEAVGNIGIKSAAVQAGTYGDYLDYLVGTQGNELSFQSASQGQNLNYAATLRGQDMGLAETQMNKDYQMEIAKMEQKSASDANKWDAAGNVIGKLVSLWD